jgi:hypothetical protein
MHDSIHLIIYNSMYVSYKTIQMSNIYKGDSHRVKHWLSSHHELKSLPKFRVEVVGSDQDAMTRQIAEAVRIDL